MDPNDCNNNELMDDTIPLSWIVYGNLPQANIGCNSVPNSLKMSESRESNQMGLSPKNTDKQMQAQPSKIDMQNDASANKIESDEKEMQHNARTSINMAECDFTGFGTFTNVENNDNSERQATVNKLNQRKRWGFAYNVKGMRMRIKVPKEWNIIEAKSDIEKIYVSKIIAYNLFTKYCQERSVYEINISWNDRQWLDSKMHNFTKWIDLDALLKISGNSEIESIVTELYQLFDACIDEMYSLMRSSAQSFKNSEVCLFLVQPVMWDLYSCLCTILALT